MEDSGFTLEACFYGAATVGERGQIVIPSDARQALNISQGDKLMIMRHPAHEGLMMFKIDAVRDFVEMLQASLRKAEERPGREDI